MADLAGIAASAAGGGIFGLLGSVVGRAAGYLERRQDQSHERAQWEHESKLLSLQRQADREAEEADLRLADVTGSWSGLAASVEADAALGASYPWVDAIRALTRPTLTGLLWLMTGLVFLGSGADARGEIVETTTFAATAATLWWFGDRGPRRDAG